jgi:hypothetical protein
MKKLCLATLAAFGLCLSSWGANLVWTPSTANWDMTATNWKDTNTLATVAFAQGDNVLFDDTGTGQPAVALGCQLVEPELRSGGLV